MKHKPRSFNLQPNEMLPLSERCRLVLQPNQLHNLRVLRLFPQQKAAEARVNHSPLSNAMVKDEWNNTSPPPYAFMPSSNAVPSSHLNSRLICIYLVTVLGCGCSCSKLVLSFLLLAFSGAAQYTVSPEIFCRWDAYPDTGCWYPKSL